MFKLVHYEARTVGKRVVGILLECFLVTSRNEVGPRSISLQACVCPQGGGTWPGPGGVSWNLKFSSTLRLSDLKFSGGGDTWSKIFGGGVWSKIFGGGVSDLKFLGGVWVWICRSWGGAWIFFFFQFLSPPQNPAGMHTPPRDGQCCGRYASYWNAF